jgi:parallel beta-helix repeat protein
MKKIVILLTCLALLIVFIGSASADSKTYVVYQKGEEPCTVGDEYFEYEDIDDKYCPEHIPPSNCTWSAELRVTANGCNNAIQEAVCAKPGYGGMIIICPGAYDEVQQQYVPYKENVVLKGQGFTIKSYSGNPADTIVEAKNPDQHVFFFSRGHSKTVEGLTIRGATGVGDGLNYPSQYGCITGYDIDGSPHYEGLGSGPDGIPCTNPVHHQCCDDPPAGYCPENPPQPCAGARFYGNTSAILRNNHITGNHHGVIVKDTFYGWSFFNIIENNYIYDNTDVGVHFRYGSNSYISNNWISGNPYGIHLVDTWRNKVVGNTINDINLELGVIPDPNDVGIVIEHNNYSIGEATSSQIIYNNNILNTTNVLLIDDAPDPVQLSSKSGWEAEYFNIFCPEDALGVHWCQHYWYEPILQIGNFWDTGSPFHDPYPRASAYDYTSSDLDGDGIENYADNCPDKYNLPQDCDGNPGTPDEQCDTDGNGIGDACDCPNNIYPDDRYVRNMEDSMLSLSHPFDPLVNTFYSLQTAHNVVNANEFRPNFQIKAAIFSEDLTIDMSTTRFNSATFYSGYDCDYTANNGVSTLKGNLTVSKGNLVIKKGTFKVAQSN